jgi:hypothetical protein
MAERRMFTKKITESDAFLDMPLSTQALYFHLNMSADDEGFVNNAKKIQRMIGASDDDCKLLVMKRFVLTFESGVIVIKHWKIHNYIRNDRFKETVYVKEKSMLGLNENNAYTELNSVGIPSDNQVVYQMDTQVRIGKSSLGKSSLNIKKETNNTHVCACEDYEEILDDFGVEGIYREAILRFIKHLKVNFNLVMLTERLESLIVKLDMLYKEDVAKVKMIDDAIVRGYKRLECEQ